LIAPLESSVSLPSRPFGEKASPYRSDELTLQEHRTRCEMEEEERLARRRLQREELHCESRTADERIRAWEEFHDLRLPTDASHRLVGVIAAATRLTPAEVVLEQQARAARSAPAKR
jgi:hypothetical protein